MLEKKMTITELRAKKGVEKITAITAYDALMANIFDSEVDVILVGDSLKMSFGGESETTGASMQEMLYHTKAVCRGVKHSFVLADMPFGSYATQKLALKNALRFYKNTSMQEMLYHTKAVCRGVKHSFVLADMPFGSYATQKLALKNALRFYKNTTADAIKLEVDIQKLPIVKALCEEGIAVVAHIGLKPQFMRFDGGFKVKAYWIKAAVYAF